MKNKSHIYKSPKDFVHDIANKDHYFKDQDQMYGRGGDFYWGKSHKNPLAWLKGFQAFDEALFLDFKRMYDELGNEFPNPPALKYVHESHVAGFRPIVPAYLNSYPKSMVRTRLQESNFEPLTMYMSMSCVATASESQLMQRGALTWKILQLISAYRPVELIIFSSHEPDPRLVIKVPLNMRMDTWAKCGTNAFLRGCRFTWLNYKQGKMGIYHGNFPQWSDSALSKGLDYYKYQLGEQLGLDVRPQDIVFPEGFTLGSFSRDILKWFLDSVPEYAKYYKDKADLKPA